MHTIKIFFKNEMAMDRRVTFAYHRLDKEFVLKHTNNHLQLTNINYPIFRWQWVSTDYFP